MRRRSVLCSLLAGIVFSTCLPSTAGAQSITLDDSPIPLNYSRDRNISVLQRARPEIDPLGIRAGGFILRPRLDTALQATTNAFQNDLFKRDATYFALAPSLLASSDWNRNSLTLSTTGLLKRFNKYSIRNEDGWNTNLNGRLDVVSDLVIFAVAGTGRLYESGFSGGNIAALGGPIPYQRSVASTRAQWVRGRFRMIGSVDYTNLDYKDSLTTSGALVNSNARDRDVWRSSAQLEYALSPDMSAFVQFSHTDTSYRLPLGPGVANRDSGVNRVLGGMTFDVTALMRGSIGVGYTDRKFDDSLLYRKSQGFSFEGQIEYFPSQLTTVSVTGKRILRESTIPGSTDYFDTSISARVDHELLRNLLLRAVTSYSSEDYRGIDSEAKLFRIGGGARYFMRRNVALDFDFSHGSRSVNGLSNGSQFNENVAALSLTLQI